MTRRSWQNRLVTSVLVALVGLVGLADFLPHTDDGCAVEQHCLACRAHISAVTDIVVASAVVFGANDVTYLETAAGDAALEAPAALLPEGRAPPLSA